MTEKTPKIENWIKSTCIHCEKNNWNYITNASEDEYGVDIDSVKCHNCQKEYWLNYEFVKDFNTGINVPFVPEEFEFDYNCEDGLPEPK